MKKASKRIAIIDNNGRVLKVIRRVMKSLHGFGSCVYNGKLYPVYWNWRICDDSQTSGFIKLPLFED